MVYAWAVSPSTAPIRPERSRNQTSSSTAGEVRPSASPRATASSTRRRGSRYGPSLAA